MRVFCTKYQVQCTKILLEQNSCPNANLYFFILQSAFDIRHLFSIRISPAYGRQACPPRRVFLPYFSRQVFRISRLILYLVLSTLYNHFSNSYTPATPCPPPTQAVTSPYFLFWRRNSLKSWMESFAPVHPSG